MANYTKVFDNPYPSGWENLPSENTPITAEALQEHTDAISHIEDYLNDNPIKDATDVSWNQIQTSGDKIAEITIDGKKQNVFAPQQQGGASTWSEVAEKPFSTIGNGLRVQNDVLQSTDLSGTRAEFDAIKDSLPDGSAFDTTDETVGGMVAQGIFVDTSRIIYSHGDTTTPTSWVATEDGWMVIQLMSANKTGAQVSVNGGLVASNATDNWVGFPILLNKGDVVTYRASDSARHYAVTVYGLKKTGITVQAEENYSTEEQVIGTWIDGKPLYRKVLNVGHNIPINHSVAELNINKCIKCDGFSANYGNLPNITQYTDYTTTLVYSASSKTIQVRKGNYVTIDDDIFVIIEYTKTTD